MVTGIVIVVQKRAFQFSPALALIEVVSPWRLNMILVMRSTMLTVYLLRRVRMILMAMALLPVMLRQKVFLSMGTLYLIQLTQVHRLIRMMIQPGIFIRVPIVRKKMASRVQ